MDRRSFLKTTGAVAGAAATGSVGLGVETMAAPALAKGLRQIRVATAWPSELPGYGTSSERLARRVAEASDGRITLCLLHRDTGIAGADALPLMQSGAADAYHGFELGPDGASLIHGLFAAIPSGPGPDRLRAWIQFGGGQRHWDDLSAQSEIKPLLAGSTAGTAGLWGRRPLARLEDFQGLKIAASGVAIAVAAMLGANAIQAQPLASQTLASLAASLRGGSIDAAEGFGPMADLMLGLPEAAPFYHPLGFQTGGVLLSLGINRAVWGSLSQADQVLIESAALAETGLSKAEFETHAEMALSTMRQRHGTEIVLPSPSVMEGIAVASEAVVDGLANDGAGSSSIIDSYRGFMRATARQMDRGIV